MVEGDKTVSPACHLVCSERERYRQRETERERERERETDRQTDRQMIVAAISPSTQA